MMTNPFEPATNVLNDLTTRIATLEDGLTAQIDCEKLAGLVDVKDVAAYIQMSELASELDYGELAQEVDLDKIEIDYTELGNGIDHEQLAASVDYADLASELKLSHIADEIDYDRLATEVLAAKDDEIKALREQLNNLNSKFEAMQKQIEAVSVIPRILQAIASAFKEIK